MESIENALAHGIPPARMYLGLTNCCRHVPISTEPHAPLCSYDQAIEIVRGANARIEWIENHETGLIREKYADLGKGHIWITDGDTIKPRLELVARYGLMGMMLFTPGMGDESVWRTIADWKRPAPREQRPTDRFYQAPNWCG